MTEGDAVPSETTMTGDETAGPVLDVLIAGGGLTGLSAAVFLGGQGIRATVLEHPGTLIHPRARSVNPHAAEVLRQAGLEAAVRSAAESYQAELRAVFVLRVDTLAGEELHRFEQRPPDSADGGEVSPCGWGMVDQDRLEQLLAARAAELARTSGSAPGWPTSRRTPPGSRSPLRTCPLVSAGRSALAT